MLQMRKLGQHIQEQFAPKSNLKPLRIWASNFRRTQFSAQCLLAGLLSPENQKNVSIHVGTEILNVWGTDPVLKRLLKSDGAIGIDIANRITPQEENAKAMVIKALPAFGFNIRPFSWISALDYFMCREGKTGGGGILRGRPNPVRQSELFQDMLLEGGAESDHAISTSSFRNAMNKVFNCHFTDAELLIKKIDRDGSSAIDFEEMKAFFDAIRLPAPSGGVSLEDMEQCAKVIEQAVCQRFDSILSQPPVRRISCGGVLKTILQGIDDGLADSKSEDADTIDIYSAHDVTLIPLIKHLGIWGKHQNRWPGVTSALLFQTSRQGSSSNANVKVFYWDGVRDGKSGLEPHAMNLEPIKLRALGEEEEEVELEKFRSWVAKL